MIQQSVTKPLRHAVSIWPMRAACFSGPALTVEDDRFDYGEPRFITIGLLRTRMVVVACTPRGETYRIISMRKANDREITRYGPALRHHSG